MPICQALVYQTGSGFQIANENAPRLYPKNKERRDLLVVGLLIGVGGHFFRERVLGKIGGDRLDARPSSASQRSTVGVKSRVRTVLFLAGINAVIMNLEIERDNKYEII